MGWMAALKDGERVAIRTSVGWMGVVWFVRGGCGRCGGGWV